jgi:hypothetical protein
MSVHLCDLVLVPNCWADFHLMLLGSSHFQPYWSTIKHALHTSTFSKWTFLVSHKPFHTFC